MLLEVSNLTVRYDKAVLINDLSLYVENGEMVSLVGPMARARPHCSGPSPVWWPGKK